MKQVGILHLTDEAVYTMEEESLSFGEYVSPKQQTMVLKPRPWTSPTDDAYLRCHFQLVRKSPGSIQGVQNILQTADLTDVYNGLNSIGEREWSSNRNVIFAAKNRWDNGGGKTGLVSKTNCDV